MRAYAAMASVLLLSACADNLAELRERKPVAGDFDSSLASEYLAYSESEAEQGHMASAQHFAGKGLKAINRETVLPDTPGSGLPDSVREDLEAGREILLALLTQDVKRVNAQASARAQLLYDCWLSQQSQRAEGELVPCADEFRSALNEVQQVADALVYGQESRHELKFATGSSVLTDKARAALKKVAGAVKNVANYLIEMEAKEAGADDAPDLLSSKRIAAVREELVSLGADPSRVKEKHDTSGKAVLLSNDVDETNIVEVTVRSYAVPGGR